MATPRRTVLLLVIGVGVAATVASCGSDGDPATLSAPASPAGTPTSEVPATSEAPVSTEVPSTTSAPIASTTAAPTTAAPTTVAAGPPTLLPNGIGAHVFGGPTPDELVADLSVFLGSPTSVTSNDYPDGSAGFYENPADESGFAYPSGRTACFSNELCVEFGGADPSSLRFVGYRQNEGPGSLTTASGVTAGVPGSAFPGAITVDPGGCFSTGGGTADGVSVLLGSDGELFGYYDDVTDTYISQAPPVDDVVVLSVYGGDEPFFIYADC